MKLKLDNYPSVTTSEWIKKPFCKIFGYLLGVFKKLWEAWSKSPRFVPNNTCKYGVFN